MEKINMLGTNPDGVDIPLGLGIQLVQEPKALEAFTAMTKEQRADLIGYIQGAVTGEDAKNRIAQAIDKLSNQAQP